MNDKQIHWYPGHMKKAQNEIEDKIKLVDLIIELLDARIPYSSRNHSLYNITKNKPRLIVLTKSDLADPKITFEWINFFKNNGTKAIFADLNSNKDVKCVIDEAINLGAFKREKEIKKGLKQQPIRAMIVGIPNVGKSTLINKIAKRKAANVENKPGLTKAQQWIKVSDKFELLDTPGILQSSYEEKEKAINLALVGSINQNILPKDILVDFLLNFLKLNYPNYLKNRFKIEDENIANELLKENIAKKRGLLTKGNLDINKVEELLLNEFKNGVIGRCTLENKPTII